jgi:hypothetical protein
LTALAFKINAPMLAASVAFGFKESSVQTKMTISRQKPRSQRFQLWGGFCEDLKV